MDKVLSIHKVANGYIVRESSDDPYDDNPSKKFVFTTLQDVLQFINNSFKIQNEQEVQ